MNTTPRRSATWRKTQALLPRKTAAAATEPSASPALEPLEYVTRLRKALSDRTKGLIYYYEYTPGAPAAGDDAVLRDWIQSHGLRETVVDGKRRVQLHDLYKSYQRNEDDDERDLVWKAIYQQKEVARKRHIKEVLTLIRRIRKIPPSVLSPAKRYAPFKTDAKNMVQALSRRGWIELAVIYRKPKGSPTALPEIYPPAYDKPSDHRCENGFIQVKRGGREHPRLICQWNQKVYNDYLDKIPLVAYMLDCFLFLNRDNVGISNALRALAVFDLILRELREARAPVTCFSEVATNPNDSRILTQILTNPNAANNVIRYSLHLWCTDVLANAGRDRASVQPVIARYTPYVQTELKPYKLGKHQSKCAMLFRKTMQHYCTLKNEYYDVVRNLMHAHARSVWVRQTTDFDSPDTTPTVLEQVRRKMKKYDLVPFSDHHQSNFGLVSAVKFYELINHILILGRARRSWAAARSVPSSKIRVDASDMMHVYVDDLKQMKHEAQSTIRHVSKYIKESQIPEPMRPFYDALITNYRRELYIRRHKPGQGQQPKKKVGKKKNVKKGHILDEHGKLKVQPMKKMPAENQQTEANKAIEATDHTTADIVDAVERNGMGFE